MLPQIVSLLGTLLLAGGLLALRWQWAPLFHVPAALWGVFVEVSGGVCPLTPLENMLRHSAGASGYSSGFIEHYLIPLIYPEMLSHSVQLVLAAVVILANALVYSVVWRWYRNSRGRLAA